MKLFFTAGLFILSFTLVKSEILTCDKVSAVLIDLPAPNVRPYCDTAEIRCRGLKILRKRAQEDDLRKLLDPKLTAQVEYELELCETAIRDVDPAYLTPRTVQ